MTVLSESVIAVLSATVAGVCVEYISRLPIILFCTPSQTASKALHRQAEDKRTYAISATTCTTTGCPLSATCWSFWAGIALAAALNRRVGDLGGRIRLAVGVELRVVACVVPLVITVRSV